jgi:hypothetical protein
MHSINSLRLAAAVLLLGLGACAPEADSAIVARAEAAGAGNLAGASSDAMRDWLSKHGDVAREIDSMCVPVREKAPADWAQTTEGRLCGAARSQAFFNTGPVKGDGKAYGPGTK